MCSILCNKQRFSFIIIKLRSSLNILSSGQKWFSSSQDRIVSYLSRKLKTYRYSVQLGTLGVGRTQQLESLFLSVRLYICLPVILSVCPILSRRYLLNRSTIFNQIQYGSVFSRGGVSGRKKFSIISSKLLVRLQPNLVWQYSIISQSVLQKNQITAFKVRVTAKVKNVSEYLSG